MLSSSGHRIRDRRGIGRPIITAGLFLLACEGFEPPGDDGDIAHCCSERGRCLPEALVEPRYADLLGNVGCSEAALCVPDELRRATPPHCRVALTGAEGRCVPDCLQGVERQRSVLERDGCTEGDLCVPCYDPRTGAVTGACGINDDLGPTEPPIVFEPCCDDIGRCVPASALRPADAEALGPDTCETVGSVCVPRNALDALDAYLPDRCVASAAGAEGRCLPACLPDLQRRADQLFEDGCGTGFLCAPCFDPITGERSGACELGADPGPTGPAETFQPCCGAAGRCVPVFLLDPRDATHLGRDTCISNDQLCVPEPFLEEGDYFPMSCVVSAFAAEGRCLPACLPAVADEADRLQPDGCPESHLCSPCFDPITGAATGSCELGNDPGPIAPPIEFDSCCGGLARCVPRTLIDPTDAERLGPDRCSGLDDLCVPNASLMDDEYTPDPCTAGGIGAEGRCLPACLPEVAAESARLSQDDCETGHLCVPCFDPVTSESTGSCEFGHDPGPQQEPVVFGTCCNGLARCLPSEFVPVDRRAQLGLDTCSGGDELCVPNDFVVNDQFVAATCEVSATGAEGRCLLACLPTVSSESNDVLEQDGCAEERLCVPCYDPIDGEATGACDLTPDPGPSAEPVVLPNCCGDLGRCAPKAWIPEVYFELLGRDSCSAEHLCVAPNAALEEPDTFVPSSCTSAALGAEGRCLPACLPGVRARAESLTRDDCAESLLCVPCVDPITGESTGACKTPNDPGPARPPVVFAECCDSPAGAAAGLCVPTSLLPAGTPELPAEGCESGNVCAPRLLVTGSETARVCTSLGSAPGACINRCFVSASQALLLPRDVCNANEECVPCSELPSELAACQFE